MNKNKAQRYMVDLMWGYTNLQAALIEEDGPSEDGSITMDDLVVMAADYDTLLQVARELRVALEKTHPMNPDEPCKIYDIWAKTEWLEQS